MSESSEQLMAFVARTAMAPTSSKEAWAMLAMLCTSASSVHNCIARTRAFTPPASDITRAKSELSDPMASKACAPQLHAQKSRNQYKKQNQSFLPSRTKMTTYIKEKKLTFI